VSELPGAEATVLDQLEGGLMTIVLNRPEAANALSAGQRDRLIELLRRADASAEVRAVLLRANGRHFCSGADVSRMAGAGPGPVRHAGDVTQLLLEGAQRLIAAVLDCRKPVIAVVQGAAAGLGAHLAYASDLVVASEEASFIESFVARGLVVDAGGAYLLARRIGLQKAKELIFFGDRLGAAEAFALGLVNRVVPAGELAGTAQALADRLIASPTTAIGLSKRLLNQSLDEARTAAFMAEAMSQEINSATEDSREGVAAFMARRPPAFKGY
jgi:2-(1,2-epoxy-1,2-dihydrophenyl)acetyl-CoA isomerase